MSTASLKDRLILVTGASRGIGRATALLAAEQGAHVIAMARTQGALEELDDAIRAMGNAATLVTADLKDGDGIDRLGAALYERWGKLDGLVMNAGILGPISPVGHIRPKEWEDVMAVNLTACFRLIRSMDPLLRQSDAGRVVAVSSGASPRTRAFWGAYGASKAGLDALMRAYAHENERTSINVATINPGPTRTAMRAKAMPGEDPATLPGPEKCAAEIVALLSPQSNVHGEWLDLPHMPETARA